MKKQKLKTAVSVAAVLLVFCLVLTLATMVLRPKYMTDLVEGSFISQYYREAGGHDVIFVGDCEVYANFSPLELYREYGITDEDILGVMTGFVRNGRQHAVTERGYRLYTWWMVHGAGARIFVKRAKGFVKAGIKRVLGIQGRAA